MKKNYFFASLKLMKKGVRSGSISQRYGSGDPDPHQDVNDPQHCYSGLGIVVQNHKIFRLESEFKKFTFKSVDINLITLTVRVPTYRTWK
jgi:hypothetical protein